MDCSRRGTPERASGAQRDHPHSAGSQKRHSACPGSGPRSQAVGLSPRSQDPLPLCSPPRAPACPVGGVSGLGEWKIHSSLPWPKPGAVLDPPCCTIQLPIHEKPVRVSWEARPCVLGSWQPPAPLRGLRHGLWLGIPRSLGRTVPLRPSSGSGCCSLVSSLEASLCPARLPRRLARLCLRSAQCEAPTHALVCRPLREAVGHVCEVPASAPEVPGRCVGKGRATLTYRLEAVG